MHHRLIKVGALPPKHRGLWMQVHRVTIGSATTPCSLSPTYQRIEVSEILQLIHRNNMNWSFSLNHERTVALRAAMKTPMPPSCCDTFQSDIVLCVRQMENEPLSALSGTLWICYRGGIMNECERDAPDTWPKVRTVANLTYWHGSWFTIVITIRNRRLEPGKSGCTMLLLQPTWKVPAGSPGRRCQENHSLHHTQYFQGYK